MNEDFKAGYDAGIDAGVKIGLRMAAKIISDYSNGSQPTEFIKRYIENMIDNITVAVRYKTVVATWDKPQGENNG